MVVPVELGVGANQAGLVFHHAEGILAVLRGEKNAVVLRLTGRIGDRVAVNVAADVGDATGNMPEMGLAVAATPGSKELVAAITRVSIWMSCRPPTR